MINLIFSPVLKHKFHFLNLSISGGLNKWLDTRPICGVGPGQNITGTNWQDKIKDRTGIVFFGDYWQRDGESSDAASGGHIDLWDGRSMTPSIASTLRFRLGINSLSIPFFYSLSDLNKAKKILFFEVK
ncbi:MAG: type VI secretion system amidase effector protein Tae4 [Candidatus Acinetobacter avistercoris]|nr:type VI secretion system amidase effector protein Tae4 [Candidatus Acinetobacter avistercoris]